MVNDSVTPTPSPICPTCGTRCSAQAKVSRWLDAPEWQFYGTPGERAIRCQGEHFVHFWVTIGNDKQHRIAWCENGGAAA